VIYKVSIPIRDLMNLNQNLVNDAQEDPEVSIPIRDLMNLNHRGGKSR